jgi:cyclopropane-fatty-acyl-phospholipid synthase
MNPESRQDLLQEQPVPWTAALLVGTFEKLRYGQLTIVLPGGRRRVITGEQPGPVGTLYLMRPLRLTLRLIHNGTIGLAEGYMAADWRAVNLTDVLHVLAVNESCFGPMGGSTVVGGLIERLRHLTNHNSLRGSRRNIAHHYDLGNDFYRLWLDETMTYSCALFGQGDEPMVESQARKFDRLIDQLDARPGDHILEIGCGWGGFALHAAQRGYRVTGITLSKEQLAHARKVIAEHGLEGQVQFELRDYRTLDTEYDHIVSIEMFEAVGEQYWPLYFQTLRRCLKPGGRAAIQVITIDEERFKTYRANADFIQKYIFPGGMLPPVRVFEESAREVGLEVRDEAFFGLDYARTLRLWDERVLAASADIDAIGFDEQFQRMWRFYLSYCEAGFKSGRIDLMQIALERPAA